MVDLFIKGGNFMYPLLVMLFFGVVVMIERFYTLFKAHINAKEFMVELQDALKQNGPEGAAELCSNTRGPVATVLHAGLLRLDRGIEHVEKSIEESGAIEMAFLERGLVWLSTVANLAPLVGFLGTVSGMIRAFNDIAAAGDVDPSVVAGGISEALITTASGLVVAIPVQAAYNFFLSKIDKIIIDLQESSNQFVDDLIQLGYGKED
ncbi:MAG: MotA/TolQ/ExbB proton channel family protein [Gemmatimonadetes bacterium]|jgi:biopolymer transport protein ExbB|nr:MotA/TolQ/ExbB proton channel family protein [Gemmatimonadota bacterium]MDE2725990.1 MotA/TolQ/ExbB proton channel family protein [Gemmatimonadota bacterium]MDE2800930.1 MotA/TolQ/ExbB proton channel family protein [Gemmatimonadota bacterium]MDE2830289.1 MotA/TolQ/ExbB proton channel family protein [Gemmatimonadota bacterium]MXX12393.1 MotA/TolQ/ExbB proton channel family protein [Gemmatimonadota bacterium]